MARRTKAEIEAARAKSEAAHAYRLRTVYGITPEIYWSTFNHQGGRCAICGIANGRTKRLAVDHWHGCKEPHARNHGCMKCVRGVICGGCNTFIGRIRDSPAVGDRLKKYLTDPPMQQVIADGKY